MTIRVVIADDSRTLRAVLRASFADAGGIEVVGEAENGLEAVQLTARLRPDVVTMDIAMPELDGLQATAAIMAESPARILVVCARDETRSVALSMRAMAAGALEVVAKPSSDRGAGATSAFCTKVVEAVRLMAEVPVVRRRPSYAYPRGAGVPPVAEGPGPRTSTSTRVEAIGLVASTGGPPALAQILAGLPTRLSAFVVVAQHMAPGFVAGLARWFSEETPLPVCIARTGDRAAPGHVYLPPDGHELVVGVGGVLAVRASEHAIGPSGDALLSSLADHFGARAAGAVLTGMGDDGAAGLLALRKAGGVTVAQDRATSVVHGMPRVAAEIGAASHVLPLDAIAGFLAACADGLT